MGWSPSAAADTAGAVSAAPQSRRASAARRARGIRCDVREAVVEGRNGAIPVRDYRPERRSTEPPLVWVHGGGFSAGGLDQQESDAPARAWAAAGRWVRAVDYRLAPRVSLLRDHALRRGANRFPAGLHDVADVIIASTHDAGEPVDAAGASAGANLVAAAALLLRDTEGPVPRRLALAYGAFHSEHIRESDVYKKLRGPLARWAFNPKMLNRMYRNYVGDERLLVPGLAFPGGADLRGLPPTLVLDADNDRLHASGQLFAAELRDAGVPVREEVVRAMHGFLGRPRSRAFGLGVSLIDEWFAEG